MLPSTPEQPLNGRRVDPRIVALLETTVYFKLLSDPRYVDFWKTTEAAYFGPQSPVYLRTELQKADSYIAANPRKKPTDRGLSAFLRNWLDRAVEIERRKVTPNAVGQRSFARSR